MFVYNDATHDSRVLREAESLARAGHEVTVMARPTDVEHGTTETERTGQFEITRVAVPGGWRGAWRAVAYPWRAPGLLRLVLLPWTMIRVPFVLVARRRPFRRSGTVEWLVVWRFATMGWARDAARTAPAADVYHGHDLTGLPPPHRPGGPRRPARLRQPRALPRVRLIRRPTALGPGDARPHGASLDPAGRGPRDGQRGARRGARSGASTPAGRGRPQLPARTVETPEPLPDRLRIGRRHPGRHPGRALPRRLLARTADSSSWPRRSCCPTWPTATSSTSGYGRPARPSSTRSRPTRATAAGSTSSTAVRARRVCRVGRLRRPRRPRDPAAARSTTTSRPRTSCSSAWRPACRWWPATSRSIRRIVLDDPDGPARRRLRPDRRPAGDRRAIRSHPRPGAGGSRRPRARAAVGRPMSAGTGRPRPPGSSRLYADLEREARRHDRGRERSDPQRWSWSCRPRPSTTRARTGSRRRWPARGHEVTVARPLAPGLPADELHPAGYRIVRVPVSAVDGLPLPAARLRRTIAAGHAVGDAGAAAPGGSVDPAAPTRAPGPRRPATLRCPTRRRRTPTRSVGAVAGSSRSASPSGRRLRASRSGRPRRRTSTTRWPTWASRSALGLARGRAGAGRLRRPRHLRRRRPTWPACRGPARASSSPGSSVAGPDGPSRVVTVNRPYADVMADALRRGPAARRPELRLPTRPARAVRPAGSTKRLEARARHAGRPLPGRLLARSRDRAAPRGAPGRSPAPSSSCSATGHLRGELERRAARPDLAGRASVLPAVAAERAARLGRLRRRRGDADPAVDAQPSADDAEQAVRGDGGRRPGRRQRPAGDGDDRPRDGLRRARRPDRSGGDRGGDPPVLEATPAAERRDRRARACGPRSTRYNWEIAGRPALRGVRPPDRAAVVSAADPRSTARTRSSDGPRAVVLVANAAAPYSRGLRVARTLVRAGYDVEIAAVAAPGLPDREAGDGWSVRRYRPSGAWARLGGSAARPRGVGDRRRPGPVAGRERPLGRSVEPAGESLGLGLAVRRWLFWPHTVRGWWATLDRDLAPADLYHACGILTVAVALSSSRRTSAGPAGRAAGSSTTSSTTSSSRTTSSTCRGRCWPGTAAARRAGRGPPTPSSPSTSRWPSGSGIAAGRRPAAGARTTRTTALGRRRSRGPT